MESVSPDRLESPHLRALAHWYQGARSGDEWPPRDAFRPEALAPATLPHLGLVEVEPQPFRVLYRVLGSVLTASMGGAPVRLRYLDELDWPQRDELQALWRHAYDLAEPRYLRGRHAVGETILVFESCALPLGSPQDATRPRRRGLPRHRGLAPGRGGARLPPGGVEFGRGTPGGQAQRCRQACAPRRIRRVAAACSSRAATLP
jgi:hypothetical protein